MHTSLLQNRLFQGLLTAAAWALAVGSAVYWALSMPVATNGADAGAVATNALVADANGLQRLFGAVDAPAATVAAAPKQVTQLALVGVVAGASSGQGAALIAVNGQPARTVRVGQSVQGSDGLYLQSLQGRTAHLGVEPNGVATLQLELPEFTPKAGSGATKSPPSQSAQLRRAND
ncbi:type II secretion system protein N [Lampropedia puyangensis]|nr:type II secretion system protein N [Lampropedia puyangensis]